MKTAPGGGCVLAGAERTMEDTKEELYQSKDEDAKIGHKTKDTSFFD